MPGSSFVQHSVRVLHGLNQQRQSGQCCDATLALGARLFRAHWSVLACCSPFFRSLCNASSAASSTVTLPEALAGAFTLLLDFFYTGHLGVTPDNREELLQAAKELCVPEAARLCQEFAPEEESALDGGRGGGEAAPKEDTVAPQLQGEQAGSPCLLQEELDPKADNVKGPERPPGSGTTEMDAGQQEAQEEALGSHDAQEEGSGRGKVAANEGDVSERKSTRPKRRTPLARKTPKAAGNCNVLEAAELGNRRGGAGPVECPTCHKSFLSKYYLKVHNRKHTGEKPFECSKCGKCYFRKENLLEHEARNCMSRSEQVFACSVCQEAFKRRVELRLHMVGHTGEMPYKCSSCIQQFMQKKDLQSHLIKLHGAPKPHACSSCAKCFLSRTELHLHEAFKHRGEKLFVCEECGHRASSRNGLQMHIKAKHRNERPYVCEFCQHAFTQKANLNMHLRTHTGEKPFQCHLCGKTFRTQASLDKHHRTHTGERPFSCEFCAQRFTERGPLLRHVASRHQEGRPHFCQICGKTFKAVEQLRVHVRRHKGMRKFECTECGYKFTRQAHLRRHMEIHDRVENYNPRQRKLRNLVIEDEKAVAVALQPLEGEDDEGEEEEEAGSSSPSATEVVVEPLLRQIIPEEDCKT